MINKTVPVEIEYTAEEVQTLEDAALCSGLTVEELICESTRAATVPARPVLVPAAAAPRFAFLPLFGTA